MGRESFRKFCYPRWMGGVGILVCTLVLGLPLACEGPSAPGEVVDEKQVTKEVAKEPSTPPDQRAPTERVPGDVPPPPDLTERLEAGQARAGIIQSKEAFVGGPNAQEKVGDIKLYNSKVAFTVAGMRRTNGYLSQGGRIVAGDVIRPKGEPGQSLFQEFSLAWQHRMMKPQQIKIINDGRDGKEAVVQVEGNDHELPLLLSYIKAASPTFAKDTGVLDFRVVNEFRLAPDSSVLTIRTTVTNTSNELRNINFAEVGFFMGDGLRNFFPGRGFIDKNTAGAWAYHGLAGKKISYVVYPKAGEEFQLLLKYKTVVIGLQEAFELEPQSSLTRTWQVALGRDLAAAQAAYRKSLPDHSPGKVGGTVTTSDDTPLADVKIHIEQVQSDGKVTYVGEAMSQADGSYSAELPVGSYQLRVEHVGQLGEATSVEVTKGATAPLPLRAPDAATLVLKAREEGKPIPVKLTLKRLSPSLPGLPEHYGPPSYSAGAALILYPAKGDAEVKVAPGKYQVLVSRGFFYDVFTQEVELKAGQKSEVNAAIKEVLPLPQYLSGDFHIHAKGSPDSQDSNELKVAAMAGEGLGLAVSTDHEFVTDYQPTIDKMGLGGLIRAIVGEEVTTFYGHFNTFPIPHKPDAVNNGAFDWYLREAPAMFDFVAEKAPDSIIQINHPRGAAAGSYFSYVGYDPATGKALRKPKEWSMKFHAIEVVNGNDFDESLKTTLPDWYSMLNQGMKVAAMGNSDSHHALTNECGSPRNMLMTGSNDPKALTLSNLTSIVKAQKVVVSGGAMIHLQVSADGDASKAKGLGELLGLQGGKAFLHIRVEAATWVPLDTLTLIINGKNVLEKPLKEGTDVLRLEETIELTSLLPQGKDAWVIAMVTGKKKLSMVAPGHRPFAFTNPIYLDANNNQTFDPPLSVTP